MYAANAHWPMTAATHQNPTPQFKALLAAEFSFNFLVDMGAGITDLPVGLVNTDVLMMFLCLFLHLHGPQTESGAT